MKQGTVCDIIWVTKCLRRFITRRLLLLLRLLLRLTLRRLLLRRLLLLRIFRRLLLRLLDTPAEILPIRTFNACLMNHFKGQISSLPCPLSYQTNRLRQPFWTAWPSQEKRLCLKGTPVLDLVDFKTCNFKFKNCKLRHDLRDFQCSVTPSFFLSQLYWVIKWLKLVFLLERPITIG